MMKRTFSLHLSAALLVVTCACGGETSTSSQSAAPAQSAAAASSAPAQTEPEKLDLTLAFTGDINLDDDWYVMQYLKNSAGGKLSCDASTSSVPSPTEGKSWRGRRIPFGQSPRMSPT